MEKDNAAQKDVYGECDACGKVLKFGNTVVSLNKNIEQIDVSDEYPDGEATVVDSTGLMELCADCGSRLDSDVLERLLKTILIDGASGES